MDNSNKHAQSHNKPSDRISDLPDEILVRILSLIGTREAVLMSLQSKRWANLWQSTSSLNFSSNPFTFTSTNNGWLDFTDSKTYSERFKQFVETVLYYRKSPFLHAFKVTFSLGTMCAKLVNTIVSYAIDRNCRVFSLEAIIPSETSCACLFACESLEEMCLRISFRNITPKVIPEVINLPQIRKLHLKSYTIDRECISRLLSGCSVLEELTLENCCITSVNIFYYKFKLKLEGHKKYVYIKSCTQLDAVEATIRVEDLYIHFAYRGDENPSSFMQNFILCFNLADLLQNLSGVTVLKFHSHNFQTFNKVAKKLKEFHNLKELCISGWCTSCNFSPIASFLRNSPNIQTLTLHNYGDHCRQINTGGVNQIMVDNSMLAEFARCKKLKAICIKSCRDHIRCHELEEGLFPARQVFGDIEVVLSQLYGFAFQTY